MERNEPIWSEPTWLEPTWFLMFDGGSVDGNGPASYAGRTTNKKEALSHYNKCNRSPYSTGYVVAITDNRYHHINRLTDWDTL